MSHWKAILSIAALALCLTLLFWSGWYIDRVQAQAPCDETELRQLRYLVKLYGQTRTEAEFEMARQRARADRLEADLARLKALAEPAMPR